VAGVAVAEAMETVAANRRAQMAQRHMAWRAQGRRYHRRGSHRLEPSPGLRAAGNRSQSQPRAGAYPD
jgi:hypothetical protein